jgi:hypothetical protein
MVLAALAAVSIPIAIHLLNKFRVRQTQWAAMRFVQDSLQKNRKKIQIEDLLLLILRCLAVIFLALAFARPVLKTLVAGGEAGGDGPVAAVLLLDNSASMGQSDGVETRFELGKKAIRESLDGLDAGSSLAFYLVSNRADALIARPSPDFTRVRRSLELVELNDRGTDLMRGIATAFDVLKPLTGNRREIRIYSDSQKPAWAGMDEVQRLQKENPGISIMPFVLGKGGEENMAITALVPEGGVPAMNQACRFRVDVANYGSKAVEGIRVTLAADGQAPSDEELIQKIEPGSKQSVNLFMRFTSAGFHSVAATIPSDRLPADNQRTTALRVVDKMRALLVEGSPAAAAVDRDSYFLANALVPVSFDRVAQYYLSIKTIPFASLGKTDLGSYDIVYLCNPSDVTAETAAALKKYVEQGGSLVLFPGAKTNPDRWGKDPALAGWLPATWGARKILEKNDKPVALQSENYEHPVSSVWNDPNEGSLGKVSATTWLPLELKKVDAAAPAAGKPQVVLRMANGEPAVVEGLVGLGRVALFNSSPTPLWNNLPLHPGFVPLMQRLTGYLTGRDAARLVLGPGETFELEVPMELLGRDFSISRPGAEKEKRPAGRVDLDQQRAVIRYRDTEKAGAYRIFMGQEDQPRAVFAVQMEASESDLRQLEPEEIEKLKKAPEAAGNNAATTSAAPRMQVSHEFWMALIWAAALAVLAEMVLAHHFSRSR